MRSSFIGIAVMLGCVMGGSLYASSGDVYDVEVHGEVYTDAEAQDVAAFEEAPFGDLEEFLERYNASSLRIMGAICCSDVCREHPTDYYGCYERCVERTHMDC